MADLGSLDIRVSASATDAARKLGALTGVLSGLDGKLEPTAEGLDRVATALEMISVIDLSKTSKGMNDLAKAGEKISELFEVFKSNDNITKNTDALSRFGDKAEDVRKASAELANEISDMLGFKGNDEAVSKLRDGIVEMFSVYDNSDKFAAARENVSKMAREYGDFVDHANDNLLDAAVENARQFRDYIREANILLPKDWSKEFGDAESAKSLRGVLGIGNSTRDMGKGMDLQNLVSEMRSIGMELPSGIDETSDHMEILRAIIEKLRSDYALLNGDVSRFSGVMKSNAEIDREVSSVMSSLTSVLPEMAADTEASATAFTDVNTGVTSAVAPMEQFATSLGNIASVDIPDDFVGKLSGIKNAVSKIGGEAGANAGQSLSRIADGLRSFVGVKVPDLDGEKIASLSTSLRSLGSGNIVNAASSLSLIADGLRSLSNIQINTDVEKIANLAHALSRFGLKNMEKSIAVMPSLAKAVNDFATSLAAVPEVKENTIRLVEAMSNLNMKSNSAAGSTKKLGINLKDYIGKAKKATTSTKSLAAAIGKLYASYWLLFRVLGKVKSAINLASDLTEVQNIVDVTFGNMADKMNDFAKTAVDTLGMSELTAKQIGSKFQAMGTAMGIAKYMVKSTNDFVQTATNGYADVADSMADISINLTKLAGDMASFYNQDYAEVAEKLQAVFTGQTRPLRAYGLDLTNATLSEWALRNGMEANIKTMTQAEKTLLRYQYVMANTTAAHSDFQRTADTWANSIKIAKERLKQLAVILGKIGIYTFKPLIKSFNEAMKTIIKGAEGLLNALGKIFGWKVEWSDAGVLQDDEEAAGDLADDMGDAADNAKKFKNFLLGIDELNLLPDNSDKDKKDSGLGNLGAGLGDLENGLKITPVEKGFESLYDTLYKLGKRIAEIEKEWLKGIDWDAINKKARKFGEGLADFLNGYFSDVELFYHKGRFFAKGINMIAHAIDAFSKRFDARQFGKDMGMMINGFTSNLDWKTIKSAVYNFAHNIAEAINGLVETVNWRDLGKTIIETVNSAVLYASTIVNEIDWMKLGISIGEGIMGIFDNWDYKEAARMIRGAIQGVLDFANGLLSTIDFAEVGDKIGKFLSELNLLDYADDIAMLIWNLIKASFNALVNIVSEAPLEAGLIAAFGAFKFLGLGKTVGGNAADAVSVSFGTKLGKDLKTVFSTDIDKLADDPTILGKVRNFAVAISASFIAAVEGFELGKKFGALMFPDDEMWYKESAGDMAKQIVGGFEDGSIWDAWTAYEEDQMEQAGAYMAKLDYGMKYNLGVTWQEFLSQIQSTGGFEGQLWDEGMAENLRAQMNEAGYSIKFVNDRINELKGAMREFNLGDTVPEGSKEKIDNAKEAFDGLNEQLLGFSHGDYKPAISGAADAVVDLGDAVDDIDTENLEDLEAEMEALVKGSDNAAKSSKDLSKEIDDIYKSSKNSAEALAKIGEAFGDIGLSSTAIETLSQGYVDLDTNVQTFKTSIEDLATTFGEKNTTMTETLTTTGESFTTFFEGIKTDAQTLLDWFTETFEPRFTTEYWMTALAGVTTGFHDTFNNALEAVKEVWNQFAEWAKTNMTIKVPKTKLPNGKETDEVDLSVKVGQFYNGGFPKEGQLFMANERGAEFVGSMNGKTAVANNDQIVEGIKQGVYEAVTAAWSSQSGGGVTVELMGDASDIFRAVVKENDRSIMRTGASPIRV